MLRRADYLDLKATVYSILNELTMISSKGLTLHHAALLGSLPALQCDMVQDDKYFGPPSCCLRSKATDQMEQLTDSLLLAHLPSAPAIVTDAALLAQFTQLPLALVQRWMELDKYEVDSGNTLAVLFTAWHDAQPEPPSDEQCRQLSDMLPLAAVTLCFHSQVLQKARWWRPPMVLGVDAMTAHMMAAQRPDALQERWRTHTRGASVATRATQRTKHTWSLPAADLTRLWRDQAADLPSFTFAGYELALRLTLEHAKDDTDKKGPMHISVAYKGSWPDVLTKHAGGQLRDSLAEVFNRKVTLSLPEAKRQVTLEGSFWWCGVGSVSCEKTFSFESVQALAPSPTAILTVECEVWL